MESIARSRSRGASSSSRSKLASVRSGSSIAPPSPRTKRASSSSSSARRPASSSSSRGALGSSSSRSTTRALRYRRSPVRGSSERIAKARFADEQDVERPVRSLLGVGDAAEAADREDRRIARHRREAVGANGDHADLLRALQRVACHLAVARLEDEQRHRAVRQQHDIRERKQGQRIDRRSWPRSLAPRNGVDGNRPDPDTAAGGEVGSGDEARAARVPRAGRVAFVCAVRSALSRARGRACKREASLRRLLLGRDDPDPATPFGDRPAAQVLEPGEHPVPRAGSPAAFQSRPAFPGVLLPRFWNLLGAMGSTGRRPPWLPLWERIARHRFGPLPRHRSRCRMAPSVRLEGAAMDAESRNSRRTPASRRPPRWLP